MKKASDTGIAGIVKSGSGVGGSFFFSAAFCIPAKGYSATILNLILNDR